MAASGILSANSKTSAFPSRRIAAAPSADSSAVSLYPAPSNKLPRDSRTARSAAISNTVSWVGAKSISPDPARKAKHTSAREPEVYLKKDLDARNKAIGRIKLGSYRKFQRSSG